MTRLKWLRLCGLVAVGLVVFASLLLPANWEQLRTGHWFLEHFLGYFAASSIVLLGWRRPLLVAGGFTVAAVILETLQSLTPNHSPTFISVVGGAAGGLAAALIAKLIMVARSGSSSAVSDHLVQIKTKPALSGCTPSHKGESTAARALPDHDWRKRSTFR